MDVSSFIGWREGGGQIMLCCGFTCSVCGFSALVSGVVSSVAVDVSSLEFKEYCVVVGYSDRVVLFLGLEWVMFIAGVVVEGVGMVEGLGGW